MGVWRAAMGDQPVVVKRLARPARHDPAELSDPTHFAYWRREADVLTTGIVGATDGLRAPPAGVEEDPEGITITREWVEDAASSGLFVAMALGRFAGSLVARPRFLARHQLRDRLARTERRGGWPTLARTPVADVADHLWRRRESMLERVEALPQVPQHGDPAPVNLPGREHDRVVAIDWAMLGVGHVGGDLGLYSLAAREEFEPLVEAYLMGLPDGTATDDEVLHRRPGLGGLHRAEPGGVGAGAGQQRRGRPGLERSRPATATTSSSATTAHRLHRARADLPERRPRRRHEPGRPRPGLDHAPDRRRQRHDLRPARATTWSSAAPRRHDPRRRRQRPRLRRPRQGRGDSGRRRRRPNLPLLDRSPTRSPSRRSTRTTPPGRRGRLIYGDAGEDIVLGGQGGDPIYGGDGRRRPDRRPQRRRRPRRRRRSSTAAPATT